MDGRREEGLYGWTKGGRAIWMDEGMKGYVDGRREEGLYGWTKGGRAIWMDEGMKGYVDGRREEGICGWLVSAISLYTLLTLYSSHLSICAIFNSDISRYV